jgi:hypothetical protein
MLTAPVEYDPVVADARAREMELTGLIELENCRRSLLYYLENYAFTYDEHNKDETVQKLIHGENATDRETLQLLRELDGREDDYLRYIALVWESEPLVAVPKSRQLRLSHLMVHCHGWLAMFYPGQRIAMQSKKAEDADALLERLHRGWMEMRKRAFWVPWPEYKRIQGRILFPHGGIIMAIAQGADVLRSYTFSAIMSDEQGFQNLAEESYTAALPTISGGGKFTAISSANPGFFERICFDKLAVAQ